MDSHPTASRIQSMLSSTTSTSTDLRTPPEAGVPVEETADVAVARRTRRRGGRFKKFLIVTHRWVSLILGLVLLAITTSGAILVYHVDIERWFNQDAYAAAPTDDPIPFLQPMEIVAAEEPDFPIGGVLKEGDVYRVYDPDFEHWISVDAGTGEVLGRDRDLGALGTTLDFLVNLHDCWLSCEGLPGYSPWFVAEVPGLPAITWGAFVLGVSGLLLLFLSLSGLWLWWPGIKRFANGVRVRWRKGRYARDFDLHQVLGMVCLPFLLTWALTGAGYEFPFVNDAVYAATPGEAPEEEPLLLSAESDEPDITPNEAVAAARALLPDNAVLTDVTLPYPDDPTSSYHTYWAVGVDPWAHGGYPGDVGVAIERHSGEAVIDYAPPGRALATQIWEEWNFPIHAGTAVNQWWKIVWFVLGMLPLVLAITGLSTWSYKRGVKKARRRAAMSRQASLAGTG